MPIIDKEKSKEYQKKWYQKNKEAHDLRTKKKRKEIDNWFKELKSTLKCSNCAENHIACLEFHHKDKDTKIYNVSGMGRRYASKQLILDEIAKCEVLCANCHRKLHYRENHIDNDEIIKEESLND